MLPLIFLHGALGTQKQFAAWMQSLSSDVSVYAFDFEGHGAATSDKDFSIDLFTDNVLDFMETHQLEKVHLVGYSMGGYVALNFALKYPDKVHKIITLGTKFDWTSDFAAQEVKLLNPETIEAKVPKFAHLLDSIHTANHWKEVVKKTAQLMLGLGADKALSLPILATLPHETLIAVGANDHMVTLSESEKVVNLLPNGTLCVLPETPHAIEKADITLWIDTIKVFLGGW